MKKWITMMVVAGALAGLSTAAVAQTSDAGKREGGKFGKRMSPEKLQQFKQRGEQAKARFAEELNLSESQKSQIAQLRLAQVERMKALRAQAQNGDRAAMRTQFAELRQQNKAAMQQILTAEQQAKMAEKRKNASERWERRKKDGKRGEWRNKADRKPRG
jgi:Spy/CpxP family protein refolding chaperone